VLHIGNNMMSDACARDRLLPAVRANGALTQLLTEMDFRSARHAEALVAARAER
jgi:hypothetical protein